MNRRRSDFDRFAIFCNYFYFESKKMKENVRQSPGQWALGEFRRHRNPRRDGSTPSTPSEESCHTKDQSSGIGCVLYSKSLCINSISSIQCLQACRLSIILQPIRSTRPSSLPALRKRSKMATDSNRFQNTMCSSRRRTDTIERSPTANTTSSNRCAPSSIQSIGGTLS